MRSKAVFWVALLVSSAALAVPSFDDVRVIKSRFAQENLRSASVEFASDGRLKLTGQFRDRAEVQLAFALAQQVVGVKWIAPTTPENVRYPGTENMKSDILAALGGSKNPKRPLIATAAAVAGERFALVVGVGTYAMKGITPIPNAGDDAKAIVNFLGTKNFKRENLTFLLEDQATKQNVSKAMRELEARVGPNDSVVLYFSTHGAPPNELGNMSIVMHDTNVDPKRKFVDYKTTLQDDDLKRFIEAVSPARVVVILDVCYSGAAFVKVPGVLASTSKDLFVEESNFATGVSQKNLSYLAGSKQEQEKILISASGPDEKSWNSPTLKHGYFTYYFIDELKGKGDVQQAYLAAKPRVQSDIQRVVRAERNDPTINQTPQATFIPDSATLKF